MSLRIAILTFGSRGDVQPFVALASGLVERGAEVTLGAHREFQESVERAGVDFAPLAGDPHDWMMSQARLKAMAGSLSFPAEFVAFRRKHLPLMRAMLHDSQELASGTELLIYSHGALAGPHLAEALPLEAIYAGLQPWETTSEHPSVMFAQRGRRRRRWRAWNRLSHPLAEQLVWQPWRGVVNRWRQEELGLSPLPAHASPWRMGRRDSTRIYGYSPTVSPPPRDWSGGRYVTGWWQLQRPPDWRPDERLAEFLASGPAPVYVGFGSHIPLDREALGQAVRDALRSLELRAVVSGGWSGIDQGYDSGEVFRLEEAPHDWLFPKMVAVVHHGGAGTSGAAFHAGVPQVIAPSFFDQFYWADRAHALGVAPAPVPAERLDSGRLRRALSFALSPPARSAAAELAARLEHEDGTAAASEVVLP